MLRGIRGDLAQIKGTLADNGKQLLRVREDVNPARGRPAAERHAGADGHSPGAHRGKPQPLGQLGSPWETCHADEFHFAREYDRGEALPEPTRARPPPGKHRKTLVQEIERLAQRHSSWQVFSDFVEVSAIAMSNAVDLGQREDREARYLEVVNRCTAEEVAQFPVLFGEVTLALENQPEDVFGQVFHDLELHHKYAGQFFTPTPVC